MSETATISEIAVKLSNDIFRFFHWEIHEQRDTNFPCHNVNHLSAGKRPRPKSTHPADVVFSYDDPYRHKRTYLHTDLKSYGKDAIGPVKMRSAVESLAMAVECAKQSCDWREKYSVANDVPHDIRGLLFVHNHDGKYTNKFLESIEKTDLSTVNIAADTYIHLLGPEDINRLFTIANDIIRLLYENLISEDYYFYYPDLTLVKRSQDLNNQAATIEALTAPYLILKFNAFSKSDAGYVIYYNQKGDTAEEFLYFLDSLSRFQLLSDRETIRIRLVGKDIAENCINNFKTAKLRYAKAWGFSESRMQVLDNINIERVTAVASTYSAPTIGWRGAK